MITTINEWRKMCENKKEEFIEIVNSYLPKNIWLKTYDNHLEIGIFTNEVFVGDLRYGYSGDYVTIEMIDIKDEYQKKGIGLAVYQAFLNAAMDAGLKGLMSPAFDNTGSGQQRSPGATALLTKLLNMNDGTMVDVTADVDIDELQDEINEGLPYYGPTFYDFYIEVKK